MRQDTSPVPPGFANPANLAQESVPNNPLVQGSASLNIPYSAQVPSVPTAPSVPAQSVPPGLAYPTSLAQESTANNPFVQASTNSNISYPPQVPTVPTVSTQPIPQLQPQQPQPAPNPPPGIDPYTYYLQTQLQFQLAYLRQQQLQEAEKQKQINKMALNILQSNPDIKKVADTDLNGALRLAKILAEAYYGNSTGSLLYNANSNINLAQGAILINSTPAQMPASSIPVANQINPAQASASFVNPAPTSTVSYTNPMPTNAASYTNPVPITSASYTNSTPKASARSVNRTENVNKVDEDKELNAITNKLLPLNITNPP